MKKKLQNKNHIFERRNYISYIEIRIFEIIIKTKTINFIKSLFQIIVLEFYRFVTVAFVFVCSLCDAACAKHKNTGLSTWGYISHDSTGGVRLLITFIIVITSGQRY